MKKVTVIAETAFNHMADMDYIYRLIDKCKENKIENITFQILHPETFSTLDYSKYQFSKDVEMTYDKWEDIIKKVQDSGINFIPCFLDTVSFQKLKHLKFSHIKIHATDLFNLELIDMVKGYNPEYLILETQVCNIAEIDYAVNYCKDYEGKIVLFHGFSDYPTKTEDLNINMMKYLKERYSTLVGFADHSLETNTIPLMSIAAGADFLEKHITIERKESDFDYQVSLNINEFKEMLDNIENYSRALGENIKFPVIAEQKYKEIMHKKPALRVDVKKGEVITKDKVKHLRADTGICAGYTGCYLDRTAKEDLSADTVLEYDHIERKNIVIVLIARLKSSRLKKKLLKEVNGRTIFETLVERLKKLKNQPKIVLGTSWLEEDRPLADIAEKLGIDYYYGDPENVLDRLVKIGEKYNADGVFRITGDNPVTDIHLTDYLIDEFVKSDLDYIRTNNIPLGLCPEIFSMRCLYRVYDSMLNPDYSEYLTLFANKPDKFNVGVIKLDKKYHFFNNRFSIDTQEDYDTLVHYAETLKGKGKDLLDCDMNDLADYLEKNPVDNSEILAKSFKLPGGKETTYKEFNEDLINKENQSTILNYEDKYGK